MCFTQIKLETNPKQKGHKMTTKNLLATVRELDLLIDDVMEDVQLDDELMQTDACWEADKAAGILQDYLEIFAKTLRERKPKC